MANFKGAEVDAVVTSVEDLIAHSYPQMNVESTPTIPPPPAEIPPPPNMDVEIEVP